MLKSIGLIPDTEDNQIMHLRVVFVYLLKKSKIYHDFILFCNKDDTEELHGLGIFESDVSDLVIRVLADILSVPVLIICSSVEKNAVVLFPLYLTLDDSSIGHYDVTKRTMDSSELTGN